MSLPDIRWKQRFQNFEKAVGHLQEAIEIKTPSYIEKAGIIQIYEFTFELAWKTLKDYLEDKHLDVKFPRDALKEGFMNEIIKEGDIWMDMLEKRNLMSHTYNESNAELAYNLIKTDYFFQIFDLYQTLQKEL